MATGLLPLLPAVLDQAGRAAGRAGLDGLCEPLRAGPEAGLAPFPAWWLLFPFALCPLPWLALRPLEAAGREPLRGAGARRRSSFELAVRLGPAERLRSRGCAEAAVLPGRGRCAAAFATGVGAASCGVKTGSSSGSDSVLERTGAGAA